MITNFNDKKPEIKEYTEEEIEIVRNIRNAFYLKDKERLQKILNSDDNPYKIIFKIIKNSRHDSFDNHFLDAVFSDDGYHEVGYVLFDKFSYRQKFDCLKYYYQKFHCQNSKFPYDFFNTLERKDALKIICGESNDYKSLIMNNLMMIGSSKYFFKYFLFENQSTNNELSLFMDKFKGNYLILSLSANNDSQMSFFGAVKSAIKHHIPEIKKLLPENPFTATYEEVLDKIDKDQAIKDCNGNNLFIKRSNVSGHSSFFIFHVDKNNKLSKISYCDAINFDERRVISDSNSHINCVTNFELDTSIDFSEKFANEFINKNSKKVKREVFYEKIKSGNLEGLGTSSVSSINFELPRKKQIRGNCGFKSLNVLTSTVMKLKDPTCDFEWDSEKNKPCGRGYEYYKEFKDSLSDQALKELESDLPKIKEMTPKEDGIRRSVYEIMIDATSERIEYSKKHFADKRRIQIKRKEQEVDEYRKVKKSNPEPTCWNIVQFKINSFLSFLGFVGNVCKNSKPSNTPQINNPTFHQRQNNLRERKKAQYLRSMARYNSSISEIR